MSIMTRFDAREAERREIAARSVIYQLSIVSIISWIVCAVALAVTL